MVVHVLHILRRMIPVIPFPTLSLSFISFSLSLCPSINYQLSPDDSRGPSCAKGSYLTIRDGGGGSDVREDAKFCGEAEQVSEKTRKDLPGKKKWPDCLWSLVLFCSFYYHLKRWHHPFL